MTLKHILGSAALVAGLALAGVAAALPYSYTLIYYADATYTTEVGEAFVSCSGTVTMTWGVKSRYRSAPQPEDLCPGP
ncbi:MAG: hypothetical protein JF600_10380 [Xanthomonadales bacterium]|nr:hypothetical protein [Xanthomonadales bacterium]